MFTLQRTYWNTRWRVRVSKEEPDLWQGQPWSPSFSFQVFYLADEAGTAKVQLNPFSSLTLGSHPFSSLENFRITKRWGQENRYKGSNFLSGSYSLRNWWQKEDSKHETASGCGSQQGNCLRQKHQIYLHGPTERIPPCWLWSTNPLAHGFPGRQEGRGLKAAQMWARQKDAVPFWYFCLYCCLCCSPEQVPSTQVLISSAGEEES